MLNGLAQHGEAERRFLEALEVIAKQESYEHRLTGQVLANYAVLLNEVGRADEALPRAQQARSEIDKSYPADHWRRAFADSVLGATLARLGRLDEARPLLENSIAPIVANTGESSVYSRDARERLAALDAVSP